MTSDLSNIQMPIPYPSTEQVTGANGEGLDIAHIGSANLHTHSHTFKLNSVLRVPQLSQHLLSMHQLCKDNNCRCIIDESFLCVQDKVTQQTLFQGLSNNAVYPLPVLKSSSHRPVAYIGQKVSSALWHCRLGHPTNSIVQIALRKSSIPFSCTSSPQVCKPCLQGKFTHLPFPSPASKSVTPFEVIHTDVWGHSPTKSIEGYRYYVSFIDECTRYTWIFPLINKAAVFGVFVHFHAFVVNQFNASIKILQSDGGGEYTSHLFQNFLQTKGIIHQRSCPYTPAQNGLAERKNRHVIETALSLLHQASLPVLFWYHSCATATYLINRMPTSVLGMKSPFEALYNSPPKLDHLRVFGCVCYPSLKPYRSNKLESKTSACIFLGYASQYKGYICYSLRSHKLIVSRHVLFDEDSFPGVHSPKSHPVSLPSGSSHVVHHNTFTLVPIIPIPLPQVFDHSSTAPFPITQSQSLLNGDLVPSSTSTSGNSADHELHHSTATSQATDLQLVSIPSHNSHPMQTRSKSGIFKNKTAFPA
ncbi:hypothetical protein ACFXTN_028649 [Malus domestica]